MQATQAPLPRQRARRLAALGCDLLAVGVGDTGAGGDVFLTAGETTYDAAGGKVSLTAGEGSSTTGGIGGQVQINGGAGGVDGGQVTLTSGVGSTDDSGTVIIATADSGSAGVSGDMALRTGTSDAGNTGSFTLTTGAATGGAGVRSPGRGGWRYREWWPASPCSWKHF